MTSLMSRMSAWWDGEEGGDDELVSPCDEEGVQCYPKDYDGDGVLSVEELILMVDGLVDAHVDADDLEVRPANVVVAEVARISTGMTDTAGSPVTAAVTPPTQALIWRCQCTSESSSIALR